MPTGAVTDYIDVAQIALYVFWIFFAALIIYLRREDKREGYPLESDRSPSVRVQGWPSIPAPKTFLLRDGSTVQAPKAAEPVQAVAAAPVGSWLGAPLEPTGNPMRDGVGPAAYAMRADVPDRTVDGQTRIAPLRIAPAFHLDPADPDPRGMTVIGCDDASGGVVRDAWVDRAETLLRYLEVEVAGGRRVLLPINFTRIGDGNVRVRSITGAQFADVPPIANPDAVTLREEDRIQAYYAAGNLYATPDRLGPVL
jgi:photosynthetic reaction center H subunit